MRPINCNDYIEKFLSKLKKSLGKNLGSVALFGSVARNEAKPDSDIDLLIIVKKDRIENFKKYIKVKTEIEGLTPPFFSSVFTTEERLRKNPLILLDILHEGKILYDPDDILKNVLESLKKKLQMLGACRRKVGEYWLWDLKPDWVPGEEFEIEL